MPGFLERITAARRDDARRRAAEGALEAARDALATAPPPRDLAAALRGDGIAVIAEVKRASPSAGAIAEADPPAQARRYRDGGAAAISVLTEPEHFGGSLADLSAVRAAVDLPVLRKDFIAEPLQCLEARAAGADAVLLIVAALEPGELTTLRALIEDDLGMTALVEVHGAAEVEHAVAAGARVIGINTRDLATLEVDPGVVARVRPSIPEGIVVVGESGIRARADVEAMAAAGCDAVLVGESLMRAPDPAEALRALRGVAHG